MAWLSRVNFISSDTLSFSDINNLGNDIRAWGDNVNGGGYTLSNVALSASSGTMATVTGGTGAASTLTIRSTSGTGTSDAIVFQTASQSERMRIDSSGNVGIGTASPKQKLHVSGQGLFTSSAASFDPGDSAGPAVRVGYSSSSDFGYLVSSETGVTVKRLQIHSSTVEFITAGTEKMRIDSSGNVFVGTTSSTLGKFVTSGSQGFACQGTNIVACARFQTGANNAILFDTIGVTNASGYRRGIWWGYGSDDFNISRFTNDGTTGFITDLHVSSAGNVGIGTTTPATSAKLEIAGTTGALLVPRLTTTERNALTAVNGMIIYNTTDNQMQGRINGAWVAM